MPLSEPRRPRPLEHSRSILLARVLGLIAVGLPLLLGADQPTVTSTEPIFTLIRANGETTSGHIRQLDVKSGLTLIDAKGAEIRVPLASLNKLTRDDPPPPPPSQGGVLLFPEGDRLFRVSVKKADDVNLDVQSFGLESLKVPLDELIGIIPIAPSDPGTLTTLVAKVRETPRTTEVVWLSNGDRLNGGYVGLGEKTLVFKPETGQLELDRGSVLAIGFDPSLASYPRPQSPYLEVSLFDGSRLGMIDLHLEGSYLSGKARFGSALKIPLADVNSMQLRSDAIRYLSDVPAIQDRYRDYLGPTRPYHRDANCLGNPIKLQGRAYEHGLGTQPRTLLAYRIDSGWSRFQATVGLDDQAGPLANVVFRVIADGKEVAVSPPISMRDAPHTFDVDIKGAKALILITEFGDRGNIHDVADWADARLIR